MQNILHQRPQQGIITGQSEYFSRPLDLTLRAGQENPVALLRERLDASGDWENPAYPRKRGGCLQVAGGGEVAAGYFRRAAPGKGEKKTPPEWAAAKLRRDRHFGDSMI